MNLKWQVAEYNVIWILSDEDNNYFGFITRAGDHEFIAFLNTDIFNYKKEEKFDSIREAANYINQLAEEEKEHFEDLVMLKDLEND